MSSARRAPTPPATRITVVAAALAALAGCAGLSELKLGREARKRGDCPGAVTQLEKAAALHPKDPETAKALDEARTCASVGAIAEGKKAREGGDLPHAIEQFERALHYKTTDEAKTLAQDTKDERDRVAKEVAKAELDLAAGHLADVKATAEPLAKYAPTFPSLKVMLQNATSRIQAHALAANGKAKLDAGEVEAALKLFEDALRLDAANEVAGAGRREARKRYARGLKAQGDAYAKDHRRSKALQSYSLALPFADEDPETGTRLMNAITAVRRELQEAILTRAEAARKAKLPGAEWAWLTALTRLPFPAADRVAIPPIPDLEHALAYTVLVQVTGGFAQNPIVREEVMSKLRAAELPLSVQLLSSEGGGPVSATLSVELDAAQVASRIANVETRTIEYVQYKRKDPNPAYFPAWQHQVALEAKWVALLRERASADAKAKKAARAVEKAQEALHAAREEAEKERQIRIGVVEKKAAAMREQVSKLQRDEDGLNERIAKAYAEAPAGKAAQGHDALASRLEEERDAIRRRVREARAQLVKHEDRLATLSAPLVSDDVAQADAALKAAVKAYFDIPVVAPAAVNEQERSVYDELTRARAKLATIPVTIDSEIKARHAYPVVHHERVASTAGRVRLQEALRNTALVTQTISSKYRVEDLEITAHDEPGAPGIHIDADPLQFPTDEEMLKSLAGKAAGKVADTVEEALLHHPDRFLSAFARTKDPEEQLNYAVLAYRGRKLLTKPSEAKVLARVIREATGFALDADTIDLEKLDALK